MNERPFIHSNIYKVDHIVRMFLDKGLIIKTFNSPGSVSLVQRLQVGVKAVDGLLQLGGHPGLGCGVWTPNLIVAGFNKPLFKIITGSWATACAMCSAHPTGCCHTWLSFPEIPGDPSNYWLPYIFLIQTCFRFLIQTCFRQKQLNYKCWTKVSISFVDLLPTPSIYFKITSEGSSSLSTCGSTVGTWGGLPSARGPPDPGSLAPEKGEQ